MSYVPLLGETFRVVSCSLVWYRKGEQSLGTFALIVFWLQPNKNDQVPKNKLEDPHSPSRSNVKTKLMTAGQWLSQMIGGIRIARSRSSWVSTEPGDHQCLAVFSVL